MTNFNPADWAVVPVKLTAEMKAAWERSPWGERDCGCDADWAAFLSAAPAPPIVLTDTPADPWQPIETAPKDSRTILGWDRLATRAYTMRWGHSVSADGPPEWWGESGAELPTHWMPLPTPPAAGGADA